MSKSKLKQYHKLTSELEEKVQDKYDMSMHDTTWSKGSVLRNIIYKNGGSRLQFSSATSRAVNLSSYRRRMRYTTDELVSNLLSNSPIKTGYGRANMFRHIDRSNGNVSMGMLGSQAGQTLGAPYMIHQNFQAHSGWVDNAIYDTYAVAQEQNMYIYEPEYDYGYCEIKVRATEE